tara:strand:+ start:2485 stop:3027 length:543 start_codon:yes stop_codon:yes gene_type:complete
MQFQEEYKLKIGDQAIDFNLPAVEGGSNTLGDFPGEVIVVVFMCNHCPYVIGNLERIKNLQTEFGGRLDVIGINSNDAEKFPQDSFEAMQELKREKFINFAYLHDESQEIAKAYGAVVTPHFFVFDSDRKLQYQGRFDDHMEDEENESADIKDAVRALLDGEEVKVKTTPVEGCSVKWKD